MKAVGIKVLMVTKTDDGLLQESVLLNKMDPTGLNLEVRFSFNRPIAPVYEDPTKKPTGYKQEAAEEFRLTVTDSTRNGQVLFPNGSDA